MIIINMQYFGNKGASSGKAGAGAAGGRATNNAGRENLESRAEESLEKAEHLEGIVARKQAWLAAEVNKGDIKFDSAEYKEIEASIDKTLAEAKSLRKDARKYYRDAAEIESR